MIVSPFCCRLSLFKSSDVHYRIYLWLCDFVHCLLWEKTSATRRKHWCCCWSGNSLWTFCNACAVCRLVPDRLPLWCCCGSIHPHHCGTICTPSSHLDPYWRCGWNRAGFWHTQPEVSESTDHFGYQCARWRFDGNIVGLLYWTGSHDAVCVGRYQGQHSSVTVLVQLDYSRLLAILLHRWQPSAVACYQYGHRPQRWWVLHLD